MDDLTIGILAIVALLVLVLAGIPIAFALAIVSLVGMFLLTDDFGLMGLLAADSALGGVRAYVFVVVPLFVLMGAFMSNSTAARYLYEMAHIATRRLIGGLATATVFANAVFSAVTGVSVASAAIFSRIAVPQMLRHAYSVRLAVGSVGGSSVLGMLIPPSLLMILYGVLAQVSIGALFIAGILPGILLAVLYALVITFMGWRRPAMVGRGVAAVGAAHVEAAKEIGRSVGAKAGPPAEAKAATVEKPLPVDTDEDGEDWDKSTWQIAFGVIPIAVLIVGVIGGIWLGWFTPTEASAVGAFGALLVAGLYGMRGVGIINSFKETAISTGAIMLLLITAQMYSRMLARSGLVTNLNERIIAADLRPYVLVVVFILALILLGAILDSSSILLITVPLMVPAVQVLDVNPVWFGIVMIVAIEVGLLTPPFGMVAFSMSAVLGERANVEDIFIGALPFVGAMLALLALLMAFPQLATWLPGLL